MRNKTVMIAKADIRAPSESVHAVEYLEYDFEPRLSDDACALQIQHQHDHKCPQRPNQCPALVLGQLHRLITSVCFRLSHNVACHQEMSLPAFVLESASCLSLIHI